MADSTAQLGVSKLTNSAESSSSGFSDLAPVKTQIVEATENYYLDKIMDGEKRKRAKKLKKEL